MAARDRTFNVSRWGITTKHSSKPVLVRTWILNIGDRSLNIYSQRRMWIGVQGFEHVIRENCTYMIINIIDQHIVLAPPHMLYQFRFNSFTILPSSIAARDRTFNPSRWGLPMIYYRGQLLITTKHSSKPVLVRTWILVTDHWTYTHKDKCGGVVPP